VQGAVGPSGRRGEPGPPGVAGPRGPKGETGPSAAKGERGPSGPPGSAGPQGARGDTGPAGSQGARGDTGPAGSQGARGDTGPAGSQGARGELGQCIPCQIIWTDRSGRVILKPPDTQPPDTGTTSTSDSDGRYDKDSGIIWRLLSVMVIAAVIGTVGQRMGLVPGVPTFYDGQTTNAILHWQPSEEGSAIKRAYWRLLRTLRSRGFRENFGAFM